MSQVIDIFTFDSLENNEIVLESLSINNGNRSSPSEMPITQVFDSSTTQYWRPSDEFQKSFAYTSKKIMFNFHAFPVHIAHAYYTRIL